MRFRLFFRHYTSLMLTIVGVAAACLLSMLFVNIQLSNNNRIDFNNRLVDNQNRLLASIKQTAVEIKNDSHADHDAQLKVLHCIVNLFGSRPNSVILQSEFDDCLTGTRIAPIKAPNITVPQDNRSPSPQDSSQVNIQGSPQQPASPTPKPTPPTPPIQPAQPLTPPNAIERLGYILNDTLGKVPKAIKNVFNLVIPKEGL